MAPGATGSGTRFGCCWAEIHDQNQAIARSQITRSPGMEQRRDLAGVVGHKPLGVRIFPVTLTRVNSA